MEWTAEELYLIGQRGYDLAAQGRYELAATVFEGLLEIAPSDAWARRSLAAMQLRMGRAAAALATLTELGDAQAHRLRLDAHLALGANAEAVKELAAARPALNAREARRYAILLGSEQLSRRRPDK